MDPSLKPPVGTDSVTSDKPVPPVLSQPLKPPVPGVAAASLKPPVGTIALNKSTID